MAVSNPSGLSVSDAVNRGFNLLVTVILGLTGLTFGSEIIAEADPIDKVDNTLLAIIAVVAVVWYLMGKHWVQRSLVPVGLVLGALLVQIMGVAIEIGDPQALGDDIPGMILFTSLVIVVGMLWSVNGRLIAITAAGRG